MAELCFSVIEATATLLTARNAKFQYKDKPFYPAVHTHTPAFFFAGTKDDDLKHAIQITAYRGSCQVSVTVFSVVLIYEDLRWLSMTVERFNKEETLGYFIFESNPSKLQLRYIVNLQLDRRKVQDLAYIQEAVWLTVEQADRQFRTVGRRLLEAMQKEKLLREKQSEFYDRAAGALLKFGYLFTASFEEDPYEFRMEGKRRRQESDPPIYLSSAYILLTSRFLRISVYADVGDSREWTREQEEKLLLLAALWNPKLELPWCLITHNLTLMSTRVDSLMPEQQKPSSKPFGVVLETTNVEKEYLERILELMFRETVEDAEMIFFDINALYATPLYRLGSFEPPQLKKYKRPQETLLVYEERLSRDRLVAEREERRVIMHTQIVGGFFYMEGVYDQDDGSMSVRIPSHFKQFQSYIQNGVLISQSMAENLCTLLQELCGRNFYYQHLPQLLYCTGDLRLTVLPWNLAHNRVPGFNVSLIAQVNTYMAQFLKLFTTRQSAPTLYKLIQEQCAQCLLNPAYLTCERGCKHTALQWWIQVHYMGRTRVALTPVFREGLYKEFHEIMTEFLKAEKCYHPRYQCRSLGLVLLPGSGRDVADTLFLVQEAPQYPSLRAFTKAHYMDTAKLFPQLQEAVDFLHSREVSPLVLSPSSIGVDMDVSGCTLKLPALSLLSQSLLADTVRYLPCEFQSDWRKVDEGSLELLRGYLERGEEPAPRPVPHLDTDLSLLCTPLRAWTTLHTCM